MKARTIQMFFAEEWPAKIWIAAFTGAGVFITFIKLQSTFAILDSFWMYVLFAFLLVISGAISYLVSVIAGCIVFPPIFRMRERLNGAPFVVGDQVEILKGGRRGTFTSIYEVWSDRYEARLDIGKSAADDYSDIYSYTAIRKCRNTEQNGADRPLSR